MRTLLVTGGAGFIGGNFVHWLMAQGGVQVVNLDKLTYAGNLDTLAPLASNPSHVFVQGDIGDRELVGRLLRDYAVDAVVNFAAESHVDRSIDGPAAFIETNVLGTFNLLGLRQVLLVGLKRRAQGGLPLPACLHRRGLRLPGSHWALHGGDGLCPQFALFGLQGGLGSSGAGLAPHLRAAGPDHQLLQQLRSLPVPGEADPAGHPEGPARRAPAHLRQREQCPRLAVRGGPLPGHTAGPGGRSPRGGLQRRRQQRADQSPGGRYPLRSAGRAGARLGPSAPRRAQDLRQGQARA